MQPKSRPRSAVATPATLTPAVLASIAREIYTAGPFLTRQLQHWRPYICPFDLVIAEVPAGSYVLDIGCGGGLLLGVLARLQRISGGVGFDFSAAAISVARAMTATSGGHGGLQFLHLSAMDEWPQAEFAAITMIDVMHHVPVSAQRGVFRRAAATLRPGARLVYKDIAPRPLWRAWANTIHDLVMARQWVHYIAIANVIEWAREEGLILERAYQVNRLWYGHQFAIFSRP
jgi:2-polyprenyl-3-methyl-5-hydroxy-6-metoxy-1,4-benzoquinol methylase